MKTLNECIETTLKHASWLDRRAESSIFELECNDGRKSFYGKARVYFSKLHHECILISYNTAVMRYDMENQKVSRLWFGYSVTTQRHINAFLDLVGKSEFAGKHNTEKMNEGVEY